MDREEETKGRRTEEESRQKMKAGICIKKEKQSSARTVPDVRLEMLCCPRLPS